MIEANRHLARPRGRSWAPTSSGSRAGTSRSPRPRSGSPSSAGWLATARRSSDLDTRLREPGRADRPRAGNWHGRWLGGLYTPSDGHAEPRPGDAGARARRAPGTARRLYARLRASRASRPRAGAGERRPHRRPARCATRTIVCAAGRLVRPTRCARSGWSATALGAQPPSRADRRPAPPLTRAPVSGARRCRSVSAATARSTSPPPAPRTTTSRCDSFRHARLFLPELLEEPEALPLPPRPPAAAGPRGPRCPETAARRQPLHVGSRTSSPSRTRPRCGGALGGAAAPLPVARASSRSRGAWAGYIDATPDADPGRGGGRVRPGSCWRPGSPATASRCGPIVGRLVAELVTSTASPRSTSAPFRFSRFAEGAVRRPAAACSRRVLRLRGARGRLRGQRPRADAGRSRSA